MVCFSMSSILLSFHSVEQHHWKISIPELKERKKCFNQKEVTINEKLGS